MLMKLFCFHRDILYSLLRVSHKILNKAHTVYVNPTEVIIMQNLPLKADVCHDRPLRIQIGQISFAIRWVKGTGRGLAPHALL